MLQEKRCKQHQNLFLAFVLTKTLDAVNRDLLTRSQWPHLCISEFVLHSHLLSHSSCHQSSYF